MTSQVGRPQLGIGEMESRPREEDRDDLSESVRDKLESAGIRLSRARLTGRALPSPTEQPGTDRQTRPQRSRSADRCRRERARRRATAWKRAHGERPAHCCEHALQENVATRSRRVTRRSNLINYKFFVIPLPLAVYDHSRSIYVRTITFTANVPFTSFSG